MGSQNKVLTWVGWILTGLIGLFMAFSAVMKFLSPPDASAMFVDTFGYPKELMLVLGVVELSCVVLYLFPRTAVLGAILLTGYLGGAVATHVRVQDNFIAPALIGVVVWAALYLRDPRVRALLPIRRSMTPPVSS